MGLIQQRLTCLSFGILQLWAVAAAGRTAVDLGRAGWAWIDSPRARGVWSGSRLAARGRLGGRAEPEAADDAWNPAVWKDPFSTEALQPVFFQQPTFCINSSPRFDHLLYLNTQVLE